MQYQYDEYLAVDCSVDRIRAAEEGVRGSHSQEAAGRERSRVEAEARRSNARRPVAASELAAGPLGSARRSSHQDNSRVAVPDRAPHAHDRRSLFRNEHPGATRIKWGATGIK